MFHVELRQFPNVTRAFNLTREELDERILGPWIAQSGIELNDRRWSTEKARLTVYEGPALESKDMGLGRGWGNVTRSGHEVTADLLAEAQAAAVTPVEHATARLKAEILRRAGARPLALQDVLLLANAQYPGWRVSDRLAVAERSVWELLHQRELRLTSAGELVDSSEWERIVLDWDTWSGNVRPAPLLES